MRKDFCRQILLFFPAVLSTRVGEDTPRTPRCGPSSSISAGSPRRRLCVGFGALIGCSPIACGTGSIASCLRRRRTVRLSRVYTYLTSCNLERSSDNEGEEEAHSPSKRAHLYHSQLTKSSASKVASSNPIHFTLWPISCVRIVLLCSGADPPSKRWSKRSFELSSTMSTARATQPVAAGCVSTRIIL